MLNAARYNHVHKDHVVKESSFGMKVAAVPYGRTARKCLPEIEIFTITISGEGVWALSHDWPAGTRHCRQTASEPPLRSAVT